MGFLETHDSQRCTLEAHTKGLGMEVEVERDLLCSAT